MSRFTDTSRKGLLSWLVQIQYLDMEEYEKHLVAPRDKVIIIDHRFINIQKINDGIFICYCGYSIVHRHR